MEDNLNRDIGVLSFHNSKETKAILNSIDKLGHNPHWISEANLEIRMEDEVHIEPDVDSVINRMLLSTSEKPVELLGIADAISESVPLLNHPKFVPSSLNKIASTSKIAAGENGSVPESVFGRNQVIKRFLQEKGESVIKRAIGTHGDGTKLVDSNSDFFTSINGSKYSFVQERVEQEITSDVRVYVVDGQIISAMKRKPSSDDWRANIARGGTAEEFQLEDSLRRDVIGVCDDFNLDYAGVDLMQGKDGWKFLEINPTAGFKGLYNATGVSPAPYIASLGIEEAGGFVDKKLVREFSEELDDSTPPKIPVSGMTGEKPILGLEEEVLVAGNQKARSVEAKVDTGADRTSIDTKLAADIGLGPIKKYSKVRTSSADSPSVRPVVPATVRVSGVEHNVNISVEDRSNMEYGMILGRDVLGAHRIDPNKGESIEE